jgi:hypothetical protein
MRNPGNQVTGPNRGQAVLVMEGIGEPMKAVQLHVRRFYYWGAERKASGR